MIYILLELNSRTAEAYPGSSQLTLELDLFRGGSASPASPLVRRGVEVGIIGIIRYLGLGISVRAEFHTLEARTRGQPCCFRPHRQGSGVARTGQNEECAELSEAMEPIDY